MNCTICGKILKPHNNIGTCRQHRALSPVRKIYMAEYKAANAVALKTKLKVYRAANKETINADWQRRRRTNIQFRLAHNLRTRLGKALRGQTNIGSAVRDLGCSIEQLKAHLESKFQPGMTWENWTNNGWHIDHIKPLTAFDLTDVNQFRDASSYTNLQPMWAAENISKGGSNRIQSPTSALQPRYKKAG